jgi:hypothetical protein
MSTIAQQFDIEVLADYAGPARFVRGRTNAASQPTKEASLGETGSAQRAPSEGQQNGSLWSRDPPEG